MNKEIRLTYLIVYKVSVHVWTRRKSVQLKRVQPTKRNKKNFSFLILRFPTSCPIHNRLTFYYTRSSFLKYNCVHKEKKNKRRAWLSVVGKPTKTLATSSWTLHRSLEQPNEINRIYGLRKTPLPCDTSDSKRKPLLSRVLRPPVSPIFYCVCFSLIVTSELCDSTSGILSKKESGASASLNVLATRQCSEDGRLPS